MNNVLKCGAIAAAVSMMFCGAAQADTAETKGGILVKTDDGRFEAKLGGRIHFDGNLVQEDKKATFGSSANPAQSGFFFRRIYLTVTGKLYGWSYKIEPDFAANNATGATSIAFQDIYLATDLGPGEIQIGQRKPFRAMEELTSSNDVLMIERPFAGASGIFNGGVNREFADGLFYHGNGDNYTWGVGGYTLRRENTPGTEGVGASARGTFAPLSDDGSIVHLGLSVSQENPANNQGATPSTTPINIGTSVSYAGRRGPSQTLGLTTSTKPATTIGVEYANAFGPFFAQAEFMNQKLGQTDGTPSQTVQAYYIQGSFFLTGETKPYKKKDGVFGLPKPNSDNGAFELTARYDGAKNKDSNASCGVTATDCKVSAITFGGNYYLNPNVRFMLNYILGTNDHGAQGKDKPKTLAARFQLSF